MKIRNLILFGTILSIGFSCKKETYDMDMHTEQTELEIKLVAPVVIGSFLLSDLIEDQENNNEYLVIDGDTVKFHILRDSILKFNTNDLSVIPPQFSTQYPISPVAPIDVTGFPEDFTVNSLITDTTFILVLQNSMRIDSLYLNTGQINIFAENSFDYSTDLYISSNSIFDLNNEPLNYPVTINENGTTNGAIDLSGYKIKFGHTPEGASTVHLKFTPVFHKNGLNTPLLPSDSISIHFSVTDLNDFDAFFGFVGYYGAGYDTTINLSFNDAEYDEILNKLEGTFQVTNPKIKFNYIQSFGVPLGTDLYFDIYHGATADVSVDLVPKTIPAVEFFNDPPLTGNLEFTSEDGIDELLSFPFADSLHVIGDMMTNMGLDSLTTYNFVKGNSEVIIGLDVEIPLEFRADLTYTDTIKPDFGAMENISFEYLNLHYWFTNGFPLGFDPKLYLFDTVNTIIIDSIDINLDGNEPFLKPAAVNSNGIVIPEQVQEAHGYTTLDPETADNLLNPAVKIIIKAVIQTYQTNSVKILQTCKLDFQFGIDAKGTYIKSNKK